MIRNSNRNVTENIPWKNPEQFESLWNFVISREKKGCYVMHQEKTSRWSLCNHERFTFCSVCMFLVTLFSVQTCLTSKFKWLKYVYYLTRNLNGHSHRCKSKSATPHVSHTNVEFSISIPILLISLPFFSFFVFGLFVPFHFLFLFTFFFISKSIFV